MVSLGYTAQELAILLDSRELGVREEARLLDRIWAEDLEFLQPGLRQSKKKFLADVDYWKRYLWEKDSIDREFPTIQADAAHRGVQLDKEEFLSDFIGLDLYFKSLRLELKYRINRQTLSQCGRSLIQ